MKRTLHFFVLLILVIGLHSCSTIYYVGQTDSATNIYYSQSASSPIIYTVPSGIKLLIKKKYKNYYCIVYNTYTGYAYNTILKNYHKFNSSVDGNLYGYSTTRKKTSTSFKSSGTISVNGYYRKNGTYVQPHTRSSPNRKN